MLLDKCLLCFVCYSVWFAVIGPDSAAGRILLFLVFELVFLQGHAIIIVSQLILFLVVKMYDVAINSDFLSKFTIEYTRIFPLAYIFEYTSLTL